VEDLSRKGAKLAKKIAKEDRTWFKFRFDPEVKSANLTPHVTAPARLAVSPELASPAAQSNMFLAMVLKLRKLIFVSLLLPVLLCVSAQKSPAQSSDQNLPSAVLASEISGTITALDLGDPRLTRHYYAFDATPGDLMITVNTRNLNGDVDVFTAVTLKPLMKINVYANTIPPEVSKSLYFRNREILILRVESRTPNDDAGSYRITFGGSFQPFSGGIPVAESEESSTETASTGNRNTKRLSSVGATIEQPATEVKTEEPKPAEIVAEKPAEDPPVVEKPEPKPKPTRTTPPRTARGRPRTPRTRPAPKETPKTETAKTETGETKPAGSEGEEKPAAQETGAHLIIEEKDGTRIDRPMSTIRRVVIEGNVIVIVLKTGRIERIPMAMVVRMAIEP
jgi:hypothetical protein